MARAFEAAEIPTPAPLAWVESERDDGPSLFATRFEPDLVEVRYVLRAIKAGTLAEDFPWLDPLNLWHSCGELIGRMHSAGLWHRDVSIGNLIARNESRPLEVMIVDLNRAQQVSRLSRSQRLRDLCRLPLETEAEQRALLRGYRGHEPSAAFVSAYRSYKASYFGRIAAKRRLRSILPRRRHRRQHPYEHIPRPESAGAREQATWDHLTEQPFQHASPTRRRASRLRDTPAHAADMGRVLAALPAVAVHSRRLRGKQFAQPVQWPGIGIAIGSTVEDPRLALELLHELQAAHVLLRVYPWQEPGAEVDLARNLAAAGYDLTFALPQVRDLVTDLDRWRQAVRRWGHALAPYGSRFQIGQAINRSKWGVWKTGEYASLVEVARQELPSEAQLLGPAVIDFEPLAMASALTHPGVSEPFAITSSLLYVDRRGAPENEQMGFDAVGKARLLKAIASASAAGSERLWVTEVNWPLPAGPHSPAGRAVAVDEEAQADYAVRYYLLLLSSGMVERIYWWQLIARGYGLVDRGSAGEVRRRPAFVALATLSRQLSTTTFVQRLPTVAGAYLLQFATPIGETIIVGWCGSGEVTVKLPRRAEAVFSRDGEELARPGREVTLGESPTYYWLSPDD